MSNNEAMSFDIPDQADAPVQPFVAEQTPKNELRESGIGPLTLTLALGAYVIATGLISKRKLDELREKSKEAAASARKRGTPEHPDLTPEERKAISDYLEAVEQPITPEE